MPNDLLQKRKEFINWHFALGAYPGKKKSTNILVIMYIYEKKNRKCAYFVFP
jgi:hypothetical protein